MGELKDFGARGGGRVASFPVEGSLWHPCLWIFIDVSTKVVINVLRIIRRYELFFQKIMKHSLNFLFTNA